jgi:heme/copper-type cytochrome/quinol oxidase subunit 1
MGSVFAIFSGFYFWFRKMFGVNYSELLARLHFWLFFLGVNITFFPMHFLGMAGMPRRISVYPDAFWSWNYIATYGACISFISLLLFFFLLFEAFAFSWEGHTNSRKAWDLDMMYNFNFKFGANIKKELVYQEFYKKKRNSEIIFFKF